MLRLLEIPFTSQPKTVISQIEDKEAKTIDCMADYAAS